MLLLVQSVLIGLPNIEQRVGNRCTVSGKHSSSYHNRFAPIILADGCACWQLWRPFPVKWAEDCALGCSIRRAMIDGIDQHCDPRDIAERIKLLAFIVAHLTCSGQELNPQRPLFLGE